MRCDAQNDAEAPRLINHAGNPAMPDLSLEDGPRTGSFAPSPFSEFALIRPYAKSHNASQSVNATNARSPHFCMTQRTFVQFHRTADKAFERSLLQWMTHTCRPYKATRLNG
jgi:hypothetical protein